MHRRRSSLILLVACHASTPRTATCPEQRRAVIGDQSDVARYAACTSVASLTIRSAAKLDLKPLSLESIDGDIMLGPTIEVDEITIPKLRVVRGAIRAASNANLVGIYLPALESAGSITIEANASLKIVQLPQLRSTASLTLSGIALEVVNAKSLTATKLSISAAPELTLLDVDALAAGTATIDDAPRLDAALVERLGSLR